MRAIERAAALYEFERRVLRTCCGENLIDHWGAAVGEALSVLVHAGLVTPTGAPTALGREVAAALRAEAGGSDASD